MADLRISELTSLTGVDLAAGDLLPIVDVSASETKKITVTDLVGNATTLIADATIPSAKVLFGAGSIVAASLATNAVTSGKIQDGAITAAKLADQSTVDLVTSLPVSGEFVGQFALDTDDSNAYIWNGSSWVSFKAAGSIGSVVGSTAGTINISVSTSGNEVTISATLDNTSNAAEFLAGPTGSAGAVSYRTIASTDLPTATTTTKGAVSVNGNGLTLSGDELRINNTVTANTSQYHVTQYNANGLVTAGRQITAADLPAATSVTQGAVYPGSGLAVSSGQLNHSNNATVGTYTKVTIDAQGHVTTGTTLGADDIPNIPASKLTSGTLSVNQLGINSITGDKLANASTVKFGGAGSTAGVVTFPTPDFQGQYFFDALNGDLYLYDGSAWQPITITAGELIYAGTYNAGTNLIKSVTAAGTAAGLVVGAALPAASTNNLRYYVVVSDSGTGTAPAPAVALAPPDMIVSSGTAWELIDVSNAIAGQIASNISFTPYGNIAATNVQTALQELEDEKLAKAGGTVTGNLEIGTTGSLTWEGSTADAYETTLTVVDPTADRTITLPNVTGTVVTTGDTGTVTSTMIADGTIVNADVNASAAIAYSKLASLTAGNVLLGDASNVPTSTTLSGDVTLSSAGVATVISGSTSTAGKLQLTNSTSSTSTTTAATPSAVKSAYDLANAALPKAGGTMTGEIILTAGTVTVPTLQPTGDTNTGIYFPAADVLAVTTGGTERIRFGSSGQFGLAGANYGTSGQVLTSNGSAAAPSWTTISPGVGDVVLASNNAFTGANTFTNGTGQLFRQAATQDAILLRGRAGGTSSHNVEIVPTTLTASRIVTLPNSDTSIPISSQTLTFSGPTAARTVTLPDANTTVPTITQALTFSGPTAARTYTLPDATTTLVGITATQTLDNKTLTDPAIIGTILEDIYTITDGVAFEIDPGNGSVQLITLGASRTPKATNFAAGESITLMVDDGTAYTLTWTDATFGGSGVVWKTDLGVAPTLNTTGYTVIVLWKVGTQVYGARVGNA